MCGCVNEEQSSTHTTAGLRLDRLRMFQIHARSEVSLRQRLRLLLCLYLADLASKVEEGLLHVAVAFGAGFQEEHVVEVCISLEYGRGGDE